MKTKKQIGIVNFYNKYNIKNSVFSKGAIDLGEDLNYPLILLKNRLSSLGITLNTLDMAPLNDFTDIIFLDLPSTDCLPKGITLKILKEMGKNLYLFINESPITKPDNWDIRNHVYFNKIFTWHGPIVDGKKYIKFFLPNKLPESVDLDLKNKTRFCAIIAGNHYKKHSDELYTHRVKAIRWFEKNHPDKFDLYGKGWASEIYKRPSVGILTKMLCRSKYFQERLDDTYFKSYKGEVRSKIEVLSHYKFSICYENVRDVEGYISEKIFDCFFAGTIPVYWGAPDIKEFIPDNIFIDKREYPTYESLFERLNGITTEEHEKYLKNIGSFLESDAMYKFSADNYADTTINVIRQGEHESKS
jgi:hypothetical protein